MMKTRILIAAVLAVLLPCAAFAADAIGTVVFVKGTVQIERGGQTSVAELKTQLLQGDTVATQERSMVKLLFQDDSVITLGPGSKLALTEYVYNPENKRAKSVLSLLVGRMRAAVNRALLDVRTTNAVAGVRGTLFYLVQEAGKTDIAVMEGTVVAGTYSPDGSTPPGGEISLLSGQALSIVPGLPMQQPIAIDASSVAAVIAALHALDVEGLQGLDLKALQDQIKQEEQKLQDEQQTQGPAEIPLLPPINQVPKNMTPITMQIIFPIP